MKNYEKYKDFVIGCIREDDFCKLSEKVYGNTKCYHRTCHECREFLAEWLYEECKQQIDWSKVPVDTPVIVKEKSGIERRRYFCKYRPNVAEPFICFNDGKTSFTGDTTTYWDNCELARKEDIEKYSI